MLYIVTLTYILKITKFEKADIWKSWELAKLLDYDFYRRSYSPSNEIIGDVVFRDLDLHFQGQTSETLISKKWWEIIANVVFNDLDLYFQGTESEY